MKIKAFPIEFEVENFPQEIDLESKLYRIDAINRMKNGGTSYLFVIYREKTEYQKRVLNRDDNL